MELNQKSPHAFYAKSTFIHSSDMSNVVFLFQIQLCGCRDINIRELSKYARFVKLSKEQPFDLKGYDFSKRLKFKIVQHLIPFAFIKYLFSVMQRIPII